MKKQLIALAFLFVAQPVLSNWFWGREKLESVEIKNKSSYIVKIEDHDGESATIPAHSKLDSDGLAKLNFKDSGVTVTVENPNDASTVSQGSVVKQKEGYMVSGLSSNIEGSDDLKEDISELQIVIDENGKIYVDED